jgi:hypothetical protein
MRLRGSAEDGSGWRESAAGSAEWAPGWGVCPGVPSIGSPVWAWPQLVCCALTSLAGAQDKVW